MKGRPPRKPSARKGKTSPQPGKVAASAPDAPKQALGSPDAAAEVARLKAELAEAQARLKQIEAQGVDAFTAQRMETLLEAAQVARGQALDASLARNKAEVELRTLHKALEEARGATGWLVRRAVRRLGLKLAPKRVTAPEDGPGQ